MNAKRHAFHHDPNDGISRTTFLQLLFRVSMAIGVRSQRFDLPTVHCELSGIDALDAKTAEGTDY